MVSRQAQLYFLVGFLLILLLMPILLLGYSLGYLQGTGGTFMDLITSQSNVFQNLDLVLIVFFVLIAIFAIAYIVVRKGRIGM